MRLLLRRLSQRIATTFPFGLLPFGLDFCASESAALRTCTMALRR
jgi:hypothetical protein